MATENQSGTKYVTSSSALRIFEKLESMCRRTSMNEENHLTDIARRIAGKLIEYAALGKTLLVKLALAADLRFFSEILNNSAVMRAIVSLNKKSRRCRS